MTPFQKETFQIQLLCLLYLTTLYCVGIVLCNFLVLLFLPSLDTNWCVSSLLLWVEYFMLRR